MPGDDVVGISVAEDVVRPEWIDYNGHMNVAYYVLAFDYAIDALWARIGITDDYIRETRGSTFAVETHVTYQKELKEGDPYIVTMQLLAYDAKRIHHFQRMYHGRERYLAATAEWMSLHVDLNIRRVSPWPPSVVGKLEGIAEQQGSEAWPEEAGARMCVRDPVYCMNKDHSSE